MYMNDIITTITNSQPENKKEQVIWEENESTTPTKNDELPSTNDVCDITNGINEPKDEKPLPDTTKTKKKISGIYKIVNKVNGKYYVGRSKNITGSHNGRWYHHTHKLKYNSHNNKHLQSAWNKSSLDNFLMFLFIIY